MAAFPWTSPGSGLPLSITASPRFGTSVLIFRIAPQPYRTFARAGQFQMRDCHAICFFNMLKKLEIYPRCAGCGGGDVLEDA